MPLVLDASITISWAMKDEDDPRADDARAMSHTGQPVVPGIWWYEVRNILLLNERRGRIAASEAERFLQSIGGLVRMVFPHDGEEVSRLARLHRLSIYDASYLALAAAQRLPLATLDSALEAAARAEGIPLLA